MSVVKIQAIINAKSGVAKDASVNDFVGYDPALTPAALALTMRAALTSFYNVASPGQVHPIAYYLSPTRTRTTNACRFKSYNITGHLDGTPAGPPISDDGWTLGPTSLVTSDTEPYPDQVACVLGFHATFTASETGPLGAAIPTEARAQAEGAPATHPGREHLRARQRGRIFLGPLSIQTRVRDAVTDEPRISLHTVAGVAAGFGDDVCLAAATLRDDPSFIWSVWSRRNGNTLPVAAGFVDDRFDTQRRRLPKPGARSLF